jgi:glucose-6-phosphate 1-epimerase
VNSETFRHETDAHGLARIVISTAAAQAIIYLHGAHLTHWQPTGEEPVLFLSRASYFTDAKPIRGGVPIIFPWFGPNTEIPTAPAHGWARLHEWTVESLTEIGAGVEVGAEVVLTLDATDVPEATQNALLRFRVRVGASLTMQLEVENRSETPLLFEEALHTYLAVGDARTIEITGLAGVTYLDKVAGGAQRVEGEAPIRIEGETDRVYAPTADTVTVHDTEQSRAIIVAKSHSASTVVWNPHVQKAAAMPDFGDDEWPQMVCVETANVGSLAIELDPNETHIMRAQIFLERF